MAKPAAEGSSVGVRIVRDGDNLPPLGSGNWPFGSQVLVERYIPGRELTVAVMGGEALAVTELRPRSGFYDYEAKYTEGKTEHLIPGTGVGADRRGGEEHGGRRAWRARLPRRDPLRFPFRRHAARPRRALSAWRSTPSPA